jgi:hypothetical protein
LHYPALASDIQGLKASGSMKDHPMSISFQVSASPGALKATTPQERQSLLRLALRTTLKRMHRRAAEWVVRAPKDLQVQIDWRKKSIVLVTSQEADDWLPILC